MNNLQVAYTSKNLEPVVLNAVTYSRVSTRGQVGKEIRLGSKIILDEKASLDEQKKKTKEAILSYKGYCPKCGREIRTIFASEEYCDEAVSGRKYEREDTSRLIADAYNKKFNVVFTIYSSRLGRTVSASSVIRDQLKGMGVQVYSLAQPIPIKCPDCYDPLDDDSAVITETISDLQSQLELSQIRRNYRIGMPNRVKKGKPVGSLPYGLVKKYRIAGKDSRGNEVVEEKYHWDGGKVKIVKRIAEEYLAGLGTWKISQRLNDEGIPSPQGKKWGRSAILTILKNPAYAGFARLGWKPVKGGKRIIQPREKWMLEKACFREIWTVDYYDKIQKEIERRAKIGGRAVSSEALLIGILKCGYCHYSMFQIKSRRKFKNGTNYQFKGYACGTCLHRGTCHHNGIKQEVLDRLVLEKVSQLFNEDTRKAFFQKFQQTKKTDLKNLLKLKKEALLKVSREWQRAKEAYLQGTDTLEEYARNKEKYTPLIAELEKEINRLEASIQGEQPAFTWDRAYEEAIKRFLEMPTPEDKKKVKTILSRIIERVEFRKNPPSLKIDYRRF